MVIEVCPRRCWTSFEWTPRPRSNVAHVRLTSCQRMGEACLLEERFEVAVDYVLGVLADDQPEGAVAHRVGEVGSAVKARLLFILGEIIIYGLLKRCEQWRR